MPDVIAGGTGTTATSTNTAIDGENLEALFGSKAAHNGNTGLKTLRRTFQITIIVSVGSPACNHSKCQR